MWPSADFNQGISEEICFYVGNILIYVKVETTLHFFRGKPDSKTRVSNARPADCLFVAPVVPFFS